MKRILMGSMMVAVLGFGGGCSQNAKQADVEPSFEEHLLTQFYYDAPTSVESRSLDRQARNLCPVGYSFLLRQVVSVDEMAKHQFECAQGKNCGYELQWRIRCGEVPREPFSLFGRI